jgi:predicted nucleic acid-binding protein
MDRVLLDTDIFFEILKAKNQRVLQRAIAYRAHFGRYTLSAITLAELIAGFQKRGDHARIQSSMTALVLEDVLPLDRDAAAIAGQIAGELDRGGQPIGKADPLIAGIAVYHDLTLVTGNSKHFQRIAGLGFPLRLADWRE